MSTLVLNKTITLAWLTKIMQILGVRLKVLRFGNHDRPKLLVSNILGLASMRDPCYVDLVKIVIDKL
jgi:hypothetical protein